MDRGSFSVQEDLTDKADKEPPPAPGQSVWDARRSGWGRGGKRTIDCGKSMNNTILYIYVYLSNLYI